MSDQTQYTMYRKDARGTITVDLNDPVFSLDQLIEKQRVVIDDREKQITAWQANVDHQKQLVTLDYKTLHRLEIARDAARKALGQSKRERGDDE